MNTPEHNIQVAYFDLIRLYENKHPTLKRIYAIPNAGKRSKFQGEWLKDEGLLPGVWDVFISVAMDFSSGMYIEFKVKPNKLTESQINFRELNKGQYAFKVCYDAEEAFKATTQYLGIRLNSY